MTKFKDDYEKLVLLLSAREQLTLAAPKNIEDLFINCDDGREDVYEENIYRAALFFLTMGAKIDPAKRNFDYAIERKATHAGVINGSFIILTSEELQSIYNDPKFLYLPLISSDWGMRQGLRHKIDLGKLIHCETPESATYLGILLDDVGRTWQSGVRYTSTNMFFGYNQLRTGVSYNVSRGLYGHEDSIAEQRTTFQKAFFGIDISAKPGAMGTSFKELRLNGIYVAYTKMPYAYSDRLTRVVFKKITHDTNGFLPYINSRNLIEVYSSLPKDCLGILEATDQEIKNFKQLFKEHKQTAARMRREMRAEMLRKRLANKLKREDLELTRIYPRTENSLMCARTHTFVHKIWKTNSIAKTLCKLNNLGYTKGVTRNITIRKSTQEMTYTLPNKDTVMTINEKWEKKGRQSGKYGKILRKVLKEQVPKFKIIDSELEQLVNHLKACTDLGEFKIVSGEDIQFWYDVGNYAEEEETGTLGSSCMRHNPEYMELYAINPDVCKMVILVKDGYLYGRALLWEGKWLDRIYGSDSTITAFKNYAKRNGYHSKSVQNSDNIDRWTHPDTGDEYEETITINLIADCEYYPYADTFIYMDTENGAISNGSIGYGAQLRSTDGQLYDDDRVYDDVDDRYINSEDAVYIDSLGYHTHVDNSGYCDITCEHFLTDDMVNLESRDEYAWRDADGVVYCEEDDVWEHVDDTFYCEYGETRYSNRSNDSVYIEEISITVHTDNVEEAYEHNGYEYNEDTMEWEESKTKEEA